MKKPIKIKEEIIQQRKQIPPPDKKDIFFYYDPLYSSNKDMHIFLKKRFQKFNLPHKKFKPDKEEVPLNTETKTFLDVYIEQNAFDHMFLHCVEMAKHHLEAMGFLIGELCEWKGIRYSIVINTITSILDSTSISVRFHRDAFEYLFDQLDEIPYEYVLIGWYHSHPGYSSFMSQIDADTQTRMFNKSFHSAIVVDPVNLEIKNFRLIDNMCTEIPYALFSNNK